MIKHLEIENFILVKKQKLDFDKQINVLTGDTGSGKSVIINSIKFVIGMRANNELYLDNTKNIKVTALFEVNDELAAKLDEHQIDYNDEVEVMRMLSPTGKNKIRINGELVNVSVLADIFTNIITIYSQYSVAKFKTENNYINIIDSLLVDKSILMEYAQQYKIYSEYKKQLKQLKAKSLLKAEKQELLEMRLRDLSEIDPEIDIEMMIEEKTQLEEHVKNREVSSKASEQFEVASNALNELMKTVELDSHMQLLNDALINVDEVSFEVAKLGEPVDEMRLEYITNYISLCRRLARKYNVEIDKLTSFKSDLQNEFTNLDSIDIDIANVEAKLDKEENQLVEVGNKLSKARMDIIPNLVKQVNQIMKKLSLIESDFKIELSKEQISCSGLDHVEFVIKMNAGNNYTPIHKTASGGEIARFLLALECVISNESNCQFIIFDEIDTGVSGHVATEMANVMKLISNKHKLLIVTHLAQVAAISENHFVISKSNNGEFTTSTATLLKENEKPYALAKMISGLDTSVQAVEHAKTLLAKGE